MTTNIHILTLNKQLDDAISLVRCLPQSVEKDCLVALIEEMGLQLMCIDTDLQKALKRVGELAAENYSAVMNAQANAEHYFCYITPKCFQNHMADHVEARLRKDCSGKARTLWKTIHEFEMMGYLNTEDLHAAELYRAIEEHFGSLPYTDRTFRDYR